MISAERFRGGGKTIAVCGVVGVVGLVLNLVGYLLASSPDKARLVAASYLVAFLFWFGLAVGATFWVAIFHTAKARWPTVLRRGLETISGATPIFALLFIPVALAVKVLYMWAAPPSNLTVEQMDLLHHKAPYLNLAFWVLRAVAYFVVFVGVGQILYRWSTRQDEEGGVVLTARMRRLGAGSLPFMGIAITFAGFDWIMSLDPFWGSTIFGAYYFAGSFLGTMALLAIFAAWMQGPSEFGGMMTKEHFHNVGKFLLAFTVFWTYIAFSQFLLLWIANIPEEAAWYVVRMKGAWTWAGIVLLVCQFAIPFVVLLSRDLKYKPKLLAGVAVWILLAHYVDIYWLVMPALAPNSTPAQWTDLAAFVGVGGIAVAFALWRLRGRFTVPVKDPYLADSLRYINP
jgi:hypothetical protein